MKNNKIIIRQEDKKDYENIYELIKESFKTVENSDGNEHNLVNSLRKSENYIPELSLVAEYNNEIIGYIMFTKLGLGDYQAIALAPLSVIPKFQNKGVGKTLIIQGHKIAKALGYKYSIVLGSEIYYPKFGYIPASSLGINPPFDVPDINFMVLDFYNKNIKINKTVEYAKEFFEL